MRLFIVCLSVLLGACVANPLKPSTSQTPKSPPAKAPQPTVSQTAFINTPIPQVDGGGHTSLIKDIAFTRDGRYLVSAGDDKLIRIWDIAQGKTVRTIRGQIGGGHEGKIFAMALSPDNRYLAVAGWMRVQGEWGHKVRLYDFQTGKLLSLLRGHANVVLSLTFSPDGRWLASGQGGNTDQSVVIWDMQSRRPHQVLEGHTGAVYALAFTPDSQRLVSGSDDRELRLWRVADGGLIHVMRGHANKVRAVTVTPDNQIVSGGWDHTIRRWDGLDGTDLGILVENQDNRIGSLSVSPNGRWLLSGTRSWPHHAHLYRLSDGERIQRYVGHDNVVIATAFSPDNRWAATAGGHDRSIHLWHTQTGERKQVLSGKGRTIWSVGFSPDGDYLAWGKGFAKKHINHRGPLEYQIRLPGIESRLPYFGAVDRLQVLGYQVGLFDAEVPLGNPQPVQPEQAKSLIRARPRQGDWRLVHQKSGSYDAVLAIQKDGDTEYVIERNLKNGVDHRSYTFTPDGQHIISGGTGGVLSYYTRDGRHLGNFVGHTGDVWSVAVSADGRFLVSGSGDQTVRLWRVDNQELLLTLFHGEEDWVAWTPQGYFTGSPGGEDMIGWQVNRGPDKAADYVSGRQLRRHFYRPDIIDQTLLLGSARKAIAQAEGTQFSLDDLFVSPPPDFSIVNTSWEATSGDPLLHIDLNVQAGDIQRYQVYVDGRYVETLGGFRSDAVDLGGGKKRMTVALSDFNATKPPNVSIKATDGRGLIKVREATANNPSGDVMNHAPQTKGDLHLVSIGVNQYHFLGKDLNYAKQDAHEFYQWFKNQAGQFNQVHMSLLNDDAQRRPTSNEIRKALAQLKNAKSNDTVVLFLAGHAAKDGRDYYFLSSNTESNDKGFIPETAVKWTKIQDSLIQTPGRRILVVDTCYAKGAFNPPANNLYDDHIAVFSATDSLDYVAEEKPELGHGILTYSLLHGLQGKADLLHRPNDQVTLEELKLFVKNEVRHHTDGRQKPGIYLSQPFEDYVIAKLNHAQ